MQPAMPTAIEEAEGANCCGCVYKLSRVEKLTKQVGIISILLHVVGFFLGHLPFFIVNFSMISVNNCVKRWCQDGSWEWSTCGVAISGPNAYNWDDTENCASEEECLNDEYIFESCSNSTGWGDGFVIFVVIPTMIIWALGVVASVLVMPGVCGKDGCDLGCRMCAVVGLGIASASMHGIIGFVEAIVFWVSGLTGNPNWLSGLLLLKNLMCLGSEITLAVIACGVQNALAQQKSAQRAAQQQIQMMAMSQAMMAQAQAAAGGSVAVGVAQPPPAVTAEDAEVTKAV